MKDVVLKPDNFGKVIEKEMKEQGVRITHLTKKSGVMPTSIYGILSGKKGVSVTSIYKVCKALGIEIVLRKK